VVALNPYSTALALGRPAPTYVTNVADKDRVQAYWTYRDIYNNVAEAFAALLRAGNDLKSIRYIPLGRALIEATNRYLGQDLTWTMEMPAGQPTASDEVIAEIEAWLAALFKREEFNAKFGSAKRTMLISGDAILQVSADPNKAPGTRLRITELEPEQYFTIEDAVDAERVIAVYIVTLTTSADGQTTVAQREEYRRILTQGMATQYSTPMGGIYYKLGFFEQDKWDDRFPLSEADLSPVPVPPWYTQTDALVLQLQGYALPAQITAIPLYHFRNTRMGPFGLSELQGIETLLAGVIQGATDEDMAVALAGLGVYATDSGGPKKDDGSDDDWVIGPAAVMELDPDKKFWRVDGVTSVSPMQDHLGYLRGQAQESTATPEAAMGRVDVVTAKSGIALMIEMAPVLAKNREREDSQLKPKLDQFMFDLLNGWTPAYEQRQPVGLVVTSSFGDALPVDREAVIKEATEMVTAKIIDAEFARQYLQDRLGIQFPVDMAKRMAAAAQVELDAVGARMDAEVAATGTGAPTDGG